MTKLTALILIGLVTSSVLSLEPVSFTVNTKKWSHVLDEHFISITINPTDLLQGKVFGLSMNSTMAILKGLAPAYVRIGSADTAKYIFKKNRHPNDKAKPEDEFTVTETHWMIFNEVIQAAGLDAIVCLNAAHRVEDTNKWDTRNSLELISFSDSQGYNLTWQLGYEIQNGENLSGTQFGKDLNRLRTILNAFPRYQHAKLIGPDIRVIHKKEDVDFWNDVLIEAGPTLDAVTWHPRWPQPSKMKVSEDSDLGYEFPIDYLEWDKVQLNKILQRSIFKNSVWIGETKRESTGTFAEGLIWARRLVLAAKLGIEVVMKQPNLMDITHPKPEYWIALLHKRLLGKAVLETRSVSNNTDLTVISHCTNPYYWTDKSEKLQDGPITVFAVNMGGSEQKIQIKGTWTGRNQLLFQYVLSSGSDPDSVFSQVTYLNGEPLMMTDEGMLPDIVPKIKKFERGLTMKLPAYSVGFWVLPEAKVKICQVQPQTFPSIKIETFAPSVSHYKPQPPAALQNIENINQFIVEKLKNPQSDSDEVKEIKVEEESLESTEKDIDLSKENSLPRIARKIRQIKKPDNLEQLKMMMEETQNMLVQPEGRKNLNVQMKHSKATPSMEHRVYTIAEGISDVMKTTDQHHEFDKFLESAGLKQDFGSLMEADRRQNAPKMQEFFVTAPDGSARLKRSIFEKVGSSEEELGNEKKKSESKKHLKFDKKVLSVDEDKENEDRHKNWKQNLATSHQSDLKGLEEKYKAILQIKLGDGKRKIDDIKKKIQMDGGDKILKKNSPESATEIQEELIKKEIELISKAEETVVDILNNQKKRQETLEDIIFDELNDVKEERINALREMHKNIKRKENSIPKSIHKRQVQTPLPKPFLKTVEYIEKNFNLEPESVKKIKRSLEEKMGEMLHNYDVKKSAEGKPKLTHQREERKMLKKPSNEEHEREIKKEWENESSSSKNSETNHRSKERNYIKKPSTSSSRSSQTGSKISKKHYSSQDGSSGLMPRVRSEEHTRGSEIRRVEGTAYRNGKPQDTFYKSKKLDDSLNKSKKIEETKKTETFENDSFELFNSKKFDLSEKRSDRKKIVIEKEEKPVSLSKKMPTENSKSFKTSTKDGSEHKTQKIQQITEQENVEEKVSDKKKEAVEEAPKPMAETVLLKNDKERRMNMLKQISSMVDNMNSMENKGGRLKRMNYDDDLSDEFEPDRKTRKIHRRPRRSSIIDLIGEEDANEKNQEPSAQQIGQVNEEMEKEKLTVNQEEIIYETTEKVLALQTTEAPIIATTPAGRFSKFRNLRVRPNRRSKITINNGEEQVQKKRHLINPERPYLDLDKKKIFKPKLRKINPKFMRVENDLLKEKTTETWIKPEILPNMPQPDFSGLTTTETHRKTDSEVTVIPFVEENKELMKDLEEIIEEEHFLDQTLNSVKEDSETAGKELKISGKKSKIKLTECSEENQNKFAAETMEPTEPTVEYKIIKSTAKSNKLDAENEQNFIRESTNVEQVTEASTCDTERITELAKLSSELSEEKITTEKGSTESMDKSAIEKNFESEKDAIEKGLNMQEMKDRKFDWTMNEMASGENFEPLPYSKEIHRERRATFLKNLKNKDESEDEEDEEDYSSEERIRKFKQMLYRPNQPKKSIRNEISHSGSTLGADQFLKMAGSTMRVMFDDVIPEAYGQTKTKIQNMGLSEYIKEFGKLVEQMRNLDQIFLNIGEAAVKGYIKGNRAEKGPYIQVISRKKRETAEKDLSLKELEWNTQVTEKPSVEESVTTGIITPRQELMPQIDSTTNSFLANTEPFRSNFQPLNTDGTFARKGYAPPGTDETITDQYRVDGYNNRPQQEPNAMDQVDANSEKTFEFRSQPRTEMDQAVIGSEKTLETNTEMERINPSEKKDETKKTEEPEATYKMVEKSNIDVPTSQQRFTDKSHLQQTMSSLITSSEDKIPKTKEPNEDEFRAYAVDKAMGNWLNSYIKEDLKETISPWLKTTKDFVQQALTTLRRQKQISEILTRDGVNLIQKQPKKNMEKREVVINKPMLPVYHTIESVPNRKRETPKPLDETLIRHLRALKPGVYVVPSEEMTNVRSEQIVNEAKDKSGMPNVVTLNIYYDKKNQDPGEKSVTVEQHTEPRLSQDSVTYYQNKDWDSVASQYNQGNQYMPPTETETTVPLSTPFVSPIQMGSVYSPHSRVTNLPNSRLIQYPSTAYHYPGAPKIVSSYSHPPSVYNPVLYVQPETTFVPQPPGTKKQWHEFKVPGSGVASSNPNSGWHLQFGPLPSSTRKSPNSKHPISSYNANYMTVADRKRSVDELKLNSASSGPALPFWNFFTPSSAERKENSERSVESQEREEMASKEAKNTDDVKRIIEAAKKFKGNAAGVETKQSEQLEKSPQSRRKRSLDSRTENQLFPDQTIKKLSKRSYPYRVEFKDHDILPQWLGAYQEIENTVDGMSPHIRRSHIVSTPWSGEEEELLTAILDDDYQAELLDMDDDDYYFFNDNSLPRFRRHPRSTDNTDSKMLQTNMIYKTPIDSNLIKKKELSKPGMKKLTDRDSSLEMVSEPKMTESKTSSTEMKSNMVDIKTDPTKTDKNPTEIQQQIQKQMQQQIQQQMEQQFQQQLQQKFLQQIQNQQQQQQQQQSLNLPMQSVLPLPQTLPLLTQQLIQPIQFPSQFNQNGTEMLPRTVNDDAFYYFFKYAYNSFVRVMKSMTELF